MPSGPLARTPTLAGESRDTWGKVPGAAGPSGCWARVGARHDRPEGLCRALTCWVEPVEVERILLPAGLKVDHAVSHLTLGPLHPDPHQGPHLTDVRVQVVRHERVEGVDVS